MIENVIIAFNNMVLVLSRCVAQLWHAIAPYTPKLW